MAMEAELVGSDGARYEGEIDADYRPHGVGVMTEADGERYEGGWRDGELVGE